MLAKLEAETDADRLAADAIEGLDRVTGFEERDTFDSSAWSDEGWTEHEPG
jgi:hypothetical protein